MRRRQTPLLLVRMWRAVPEPPPLAHAMSAPSAILFDIGDTVLQERRFDLEAGILAAMPELVAQVPILARAFREQLREHHRACREILLARWLLERVPELAGQSANGIEDAVWSAVVTLVPTPGIAEVLRRLHADGVAMAAISNASFSGRILRRELDRYGLGGDFQFVLSSGDLGIRKPAAGIFREALSRLGVPADASWFVGDTWAEDITGALNAGLRAIWLTAADATLAVEPGVRCVRDWTGFHDIYVASRTHTEAR